MITTHLIMFFFNNGGGSPPVADAVSDAPIMLVRFAKLGVR